MCPDVRKHLDHHDIEAELKIVEQARAQSRAEAAALEKLKWEARLAFMSKGTATEAEFERRWPQICSEMLSRQAYGVMVKK